MKTERIIISFIAVVVGIIAAGIVFYIYQSTKTVPPHKTKTIAPISPTPTSTAENILTIDLPNDEDVVDKKTITVSGKTLSNATLLISTQSSDNVVSPSATGTFSATVTIDDGINQITITAIAPDGQEQKITRTVTYSTESF